MAWTGILGCIYELGIELEKNVCPCKELWQFTDKSKIPPQGNERSESGLVPRLSVPPEVKFQWTENLSSPPVAGGGKLDRDELEVGVGVTERSLTATVAIASVASLFLLVLGPAGSWQYKWPPGLGIDWSVYVALTSVALVLNTWCLLRCQGWIRLWIILMILVAIVSALNLATMYSLERTHVVNAHWNPWSSREHSR